MINLFIFSVITLCVPADDSYDCDWEINLIDSLQNSPEQTYGLLFSHWKEDNIVGFTDYGLKKIYIEKQAVGFYSTLSCNVLWHEIQHAWGFVEEELKLCSYTMREHVERYNRLNFYPKSDLSLPNDE